MNNESGMTLVEVLVVLALVGISMGTTLHFLTPEDPSIESGARQVEGYFKQLRARAMATTSAYRISPVDTSHLQAETASSCSAATWSQEPAFGQELPLGMTLASTAWNLCFSSRGIASSNLVVTLNQRYGDTAQVEILMGGMARVLP